MKDMSQSSNKLGVVVFFFFGFEGPSVHLNLYSSVKVQSCTLVSV